MKKLSIYLASAICLLVAVSCKDKEEEKTYSLSGFQIEGVVAYIAAGESQQITPNFSSLRSSASEMPEKIGLYYQVNTAKRDTVSRDIKTNPVKSFSYKADTLGNYTITCYAFDASGKQYSSSASASFRAIDPGKALTGIEGTAPAGKKYIEKTIGGQTWMAQNLYETPAGLPYESCEVLNPIFGRFYTYEEALTACPDGWHLPTQAEWDALGTEAGPLMADALFLNGQLWTYTKEVSITNALGFNAIPAGYIDRSYIVNVNSGAKEYAMFWTADAKDADLAYYRYIFGTNPTVQKGEGSRKTLALSVRCVK